MNNHEEIVLCERITLDDAALEAIETFYNGCSYALRIDENGYPLVGFGCYGVHVNLAQGKHKLFLIWFRETSNNYDDNVVRLPIRHETLAKLLERKPCSRCGSPFFKKRVEVK